MLQWFPFLTQDFMIMTLRVITAAVLCGLVGFEREIKRHPAGFRTHLLVGVGSCIMMLLSLYGFRPYLHEYNNIQFDPSRIPSYVISGIGFLGTGTILVKGATVRGLTTAASIWIVAGLGLIIGVGMYAPAILTTVIVLVSLNLLNRFEVKSNKCKEMNIDIVVSKGTNCLTEVVDILEKQGINMQQIIIEDVSKNEKRYKLCTFISKEMERAKICDQLSNVNGIQQII